MCPWSKTHIAGMDPQLGVHTGAEGQVPARVKRLASQPRAAEAPLLTLWDARFPGRLQQKPPAAAPPPAASPPGVWPDSSSY